MSIRFWLPKKTTQRVVSQKSFTFNGKVLPYMLTMSAKAQHLRITVYRDGRFAVTAPRFLSNEKIDAFILEKSAWILSKMSYYKTLPAPTVAKNTKEEYEKYKEKARAFVHAKILQLNTTYNFSYNDIRIKNHKTLWGSCSKKRNLNFNYKIVQLPERLADYIIVHELCHLKEFNHGKEFWDLVAKMIPDHKQLRQELRMTALTLE